MVSDVTLKKLLILSMISLFTLALSPGPAAAANSTPDSSPSVLGDKSQDNEAGFSQEGASLEAEEASNPKAEKSYEGPLGGLGISCEDQKDLQALALGTYGNLIKAVTGAPGVVNCPSTPESPGDSSDQPKEGGKPESGK